MNHALKLFGAVSLSLGLAACGSSSNNNPSVGSVVDVAAENGNFTTLVAALEATGLDATLDDPDGNFTVFAPTDDAFDLLPEGVLEDLLDDPDTLSSILTYHVIGDAQIDSAGAIEAAGSTVETVNGASVGISLNGENVMVNLSMVTMVDVEADNGIIHVIDAVLMPPEMGGDTNLTIAEIASGNGNFDTLVAALDAAGLVPTLSDPDETFTVFAPTDDAFAAIPEHLLNAILDDEELLQALLMQHVIPGTSVDSVNAYAAIGSDVQMGNDAELAITTTGDAGERVLRIGGIEITLFDIYASNGVIHVVDAVIVGDLQLPAQGSIVEVAQADGRFETLVAALQATDLDGVLDDLSEIYTVFAPTDDAFAALGDGALDDLTTEELSDILLYHVFGGQAVMSGAAVGIAEGDSIIDMANGDEVALSLSGDNLLINLSTVVEADALAENGVIHAIDSVMMPPVERGEPENNIVETAIAADDFDTLVQLVIDAELDGVLSGEGPFTVFAPTDAAFAALEQSTLDALNNDQTLLQQVLLGHVIGAEVNSVAAYSLNGQSAETAADDFSVMIDIVDGMLTVGGATVETTDIYTSNGIIHVIDTVIVPEE